VLAKILADNAVTGADSLLIQGANTSDTATQRAIAELFKRRLVMLSEFTAKQRLNQSLIKRITGGDTLRGCAIYSLAFNFTATFSVAIACNDIPKGDSMDAALLSRMFIVPFVNKYEKNSDSIVDYLVENEGAGILNRLMEGKKWALEEGITPPDEWKTAKEDYRKSIDKHSEFLTACIEIIEDYDPKKDGDKHFITFKKIKEAYIAHAKKNGMEEKEAQRTAWNLGESLISYGGIAERKAAVRGYLNVRLKNEESIFSDDEQ